MDQWRFFCRSARGPGGDRRRPIKLGSPCAAAIGGSLSTRRLFSSRILAAHGHPQRENSSGGTLGVRRCALENLVIPILRCQLDRRGVEGRRLIGQASAKEPLVCEMQPAGY